MNINRHNYETFFLLYVDKELSAADRKMVEQFVQENPDLQIELALLQQTVLPADEVVLHKKNWLYMEEDIAALQENLLLYADGELAATDQESIAALLDTNMAAKAAWDILQQTKLQPDMSLSFPDKQSLYRKEAARVVGFKWWRAAAAAVLLGFGTWVGLSVYQSGNEKFSDTAKAVNQNNPPAKQQNVIAISADTLLSGPGANNALAETGRTKTPVQQAVINFKESIANAAEKQAYAKEINQATDDQNTAVQSIKKQDNNLPKPYFENINNKTGNENITANVQSENNSARVSGNNETVVNKISPKENNAGVPDISTSKTNTGMIALQVANSNAADNGENNNSYLNVDDNKAKRSALGGFIRKAKRVLERTTNVKTGEGIKIAGFEIALK